MKPKRTFFGACLLVILAGSGGHAQNKVYIQTKPSVSRALAGYAYIGGIEAPAEGITVALCSSDWSTVLASTQTDARGHFKLETPKTGDLFYLRFSAGGVNPYQLPVKIKKNARSELRIYLHNAT